MATDRQKTAYITGGASGIGRSLTSYLLSKNWQVFISDVNLASARSFADEHNSSSSTPTLHYTHCDTKSWSSQLTAFQTALETFNGRIDFVAPIAGIGERAFVPPLIQGQEYGKEGEFIEPNLEVIDIDLTGVLYTLSLAIQQFRRQEALPFRDPTDGKPSKGKIGLVASVCGLYCVPTLPIYTAAKHALTGLTRSYGALLTNESMTINAVAPNVVRTNISPDWFYEDMEKKGLMTGMEGVIEAFEEIIEGDESGEVFECGPKGGWMKREGVEYLDDMTERVCKELEGRSWGLHYG